MRKDKDFNRNTTKSSIEIPKLSPQIPTYSDMQTFIMENYVRPLQKHTTVLRSLQEK